MTRQIKFRIWNTYQKKFYQPDEIATTGDGTFLFWDYHEDSGKSWAHDCWNSEDKGLYVMQMWTGLLDKNSKEIYEGDIVSWKHPMEDFGEVLFVTVDLGPDVGFFGVKTKRLGVCHFQSDDEYEVVGNIFENRQLLK